MARSSMPCFAYSCTPQAICVGDSTSSDVSASANCLAARYTTSVLGTSRSQIQCWYRTRRMAGKG
eukprot:1081103-Rhodomonas_salina.2